MSDLNVFRYQDTDVRTVIFDGEPWFVLADLCKVLGIANPSDVASRLDADALGTTEVIDSMGRRQTARTVNEAGMYEVVFLSRRPSAKNFKRWVTREVLPSIRKNGSYGQAVELTEDEIVHQALQIQTRKVKELEAKVVEDAPKVAYHERFVAADDDMVTVEHFAAQFGSTGPAVRALLKDRKVAVRRRVGSHWSRDKGEMVPDYEWRPRAGVPSQEWFELRPQHNAPRLHNGQVRQTMYVRQFYANDLAEKLGLSHPTLPVDDARPSSVKEQP